MQLKDNIIMIQRVSMTLAALLFLSACSTTPSEGTRRNYNVITAEEIEAVNASNLFQVVERLRPRWLDVRAQRSFNATTQLVVFQGQTYLGGVDMLRQFGKDVATEIRYLDGATASATLPGMGTRQLEGAIVINPR